MNKCISFASPEYAEASRALARTAWQYFDAVKIYTPRDLPPDFYQRNKKHFGYRRGFGYWIWKPFIILEELKRLAPDDVLFYADSQCKFVSDPSPLYGLLDNGIGLFHQRREKHKNSRFTRGDCFRLMGCDGPAYRDGDNLATTYSIWQNTPQALAFVTEWLKWCENYAVVSDQKSEFNSADFKDHRHDQSIASLLAIRDKIKTICDPSQWGLGYREAGQTFPQIINVDRKVLSPWLRRPTTSSIIEISTTAACPLKCTYCPQDKLEAAYQGPKELTLEKFESCLNNLIPGDAIYFAGFTEPCIAKDFMRMYRMALERSHRVRLYTTGNGLKPGDALELASSILLEKIVLHLPDAKGSLKFTPHIVDTLNVLSRHKDVEVMAMDNEPHVAVKHLWDLFPRNYGAMIDRAGNLDTPLVQINHRRIEGPIKCGAAPQLDHPVLLPSGELVLCCMDYSLVHIVGDLSDTPYSEILRGPVIQDILAKQRNGEDVICRKCTCAVPI